MDRNITHKLTFDDVLLKPLFSEVRSRRDVCLSTLLGNKGVETPIISANMDTVTGEEMAYAMGIGAGGMGIVHRFMSVDDNIQIIKNLVDRQVNLIAATVGVNDYAVDRACHMIAAGANVICIDIAHGWCRAMEDTLSKLRSSIVVIGKGETTLIAGNVATYDAARDLFKWGADVVKVGVGPGSLCTTRLQAGVGVPQLSAIIGAKAAADRFNLDHRYGTRQRASIIADGGIRNSGDIVKALAAGADAVMVGSLFAGCDETPGERTIIVHGIGGLEDGTGRIPPVYGKKYRGMASVDAQRDWRSGQKDEDYHEEGEVKLVKCKGSVLPIVKKLCNGIQSGCAYMNAYDLRQLRANSVHRFVRVTPLGYSENTPHLLDGGE
jgi:IMP dehydrogenase